MIIWTKAHIPAALLQKWLQHQRDFDTANPGCHFEITADEPSLSIEQMLEGIEVNPPLPHLKVFKR
jgi:hypothetical protein